MIQNADIEGTGSDQTALVDNTNTQIDPTSQTVNPLQQCDDLQSASLSGHASPMPHDFGSST